MKLALALLVTAAIMVACASQRVSPPAPLPPVVIDTACEWAQPIKVNINDTVETKQAALAAWKTYNKNCPSKALGN